MRSLLMFPLVCVVTTVLPLPAQSTYQVSPTGYATTQGNVVFGTDLPDTKGIVQQIHDDAVAPSPFSVKAMAFRRGGWAATANAAFAANVTLRLSTATVAAGAMSTVYSANHGANLTEVITTTTVNMPASTGPTSPTGAPATFDLVIPFNTPFVFPPTKQSLCWELRIHSGTPRRVSLDCVSVGGISGFTLKYSGTGCTASDQTQAAALIPDSGGGSSSSSSSTGVWQKTAHSSNLRGYASNVTGGKWIYTLALQAQYLARNQPFQWLIGASNTKWGAISLPFDLSVLGGPGCSLYVSPDLIRTGMTDQSGFPLTGLPSAALSWVHAPALEGIHTFHQIISNDPGKPGLKLVATDSLELVTPVSPPVARVGTLRDDQPLSGTATDELIITQFTYN